MVDRSRKNVIVPMESVDIEYTTLKGAAEVIASLIARYGEAANIDYYEPPYDDCRYLYVFAPRPETDAEMKNRIKDEERMEAAIAVRDRQEFERLSKLFGKSE